MIAAAILSVVLAKFANGQALPRESKAKSVEAQSPNAKLVGAWESPAQLYHASIGKTLGTLRIGAQGIEFVPTKGTSVHWTFAQIKQLDIDTHRLVLIGYDNRKWPLPDTRRVELRFKNDIPATVAGSLTAKIARPVRNGIPDPDARADTVIAVRRSKHYGGSNGFLRIRQQGIDYVTTQPGQSRSWRWQDIQTVSNPDPYHLFVFGYRDSYAFDLKDSLTRQVFNHISDEIWTYNDGEM
ncbi:MAG: hypothetical protein HIU91_16035, partial [Acidobacteria bacterium]|nr:hypothetical protein [Acidobacteriota bacterium]